MSGPLSSVTSSDLKPFHSPPQNFSLVFVWNPFLHTETLEKLRLLDFVDEGNFFSFLSLLLDLVILHVAHLWILHVSPYLPRPSRLSLPSLSPEPSTFPFCFLQIFLVP